MKWFDGLKWGVQYAESGNVHAAFASRADAVEWRARNKTTHDLYRVVAL